ncbi:cytochrome ubiquinol oxidase subunit I, partial [Streptomyces sp. NPDC048551]|uniref:cytochrome ubiquinol oxidase subunit I n=1 Tax=Streptomyces sp. NPDC048551 TaxID=3155758 RepID=UPI003419501D
MDLALAPETLARWQFGITTVYHFLFVPLTISLAALVAILQTAWVRSEKEKYLKATKFWGKLFLINIAMGVVTGIVQGGGGSVRAWLGWQQRQADQAIRDLEAQLA